MKLIIKKKLITEAKTKLKGLQNDSDYEMTHMNADNILCDLLEELGLSDVVEEFRKVGKWYA